MKTVSAVRFKPKPECYDEFLEECKKRSAWRREHPNVLQRIIACSDKEVIEITIIDDLEFVLEKQESGLTWLDGLRHMLEEYNEQDRLEAVNREHIIDRPDSSEGHLACSVAM